MFSFEKITGAIFNTNAHKFDKLVKYLQKYDDDFDELPPMLKNIDINTCDDEGKNLLHKFSHKPQVILNMLLDHGIDINQRDNLGKTPIFYADSSKFSFYIQHGADISIRDNHGHSVLYYNSRYYLTGYVWLLINHSIQQGVEIDYSEYSPDEVFHKAILFRDMTKMKEMLALDNTLANKNIPYTWLNTPEGLTPLYLACHNDLQDEFNLLMEHGADVKEPTLLLRLIHMIHRDVTPSFIKMIQRLIDLGADIHDKNDRFGQRASCLQQLTQESTSCSHVFGNGWGESLLHECYKSAELMEMCLKAGVDVHSRTIDRKNMIMRSETITCLDAEPLQYMTLFTSDISIYKVLFEYGADPNLQNAYGMNAFMSICSSWVLGYASDENMLALIQLFLDKGANVYLKNKSGMTVFDLLCHSYQLSDKKRAKILKFIHEKEKLLILHPRTNEIMYHLLN